MTLPLDFLTTIPCLDALGRVVPAPCPAGWRGVRARTQAEVDEMVPVLLRAEAAVRFLDLELRGPVNLMAYLSCQLCGGTGEIIEHHDYADERLSCPCQGECPLHWVTAHGGAEPVHPDWLRGLRDQCQATGVLFFFVGWGEWQSIHDCYGIALAIDRGDYEVGEWHGTRPFERGCICGSGHGTMVRVGNGTAGRLLDDRTWDEMPTAAQEAK